MSTEIVPLGTASAIPTRERHLSATALTRENEILLFDCGEGTQMQMLRAGLKRSRISAIFISHFHGDHLYGLLGMLSTMGLLRREHPLTIVGPQGLGAFLDSVPGSEHYQDDSFPLHLVELPETTQNEVVFETHSYRVRACPLEHRLFTVGYRYEEKEYPGHLQVEKANALGVSAYEDFRRLKAGHSVRLASGRVVQPEDVLEGRRPGLVFAYVTDTRPCRGGHELARGADLLIHEATFGANLHERAVETGHSTATEAATVAREAGARRLLLTHFSARFSDVSPLVEEARRIFEHTDAAIELHRYPLDHL